MKTVFKSAALLVLSVLSFPAWAQQFPSWNVSGNTASFEQAQGRTYTGVGNNAPKLRCSITVISGGSVKVVYDKYDAAPGLLAVSVPNIHAEITYTVFSKPVMIETQGLFETSPTAKPKIARATGFGTETKGQYQGGRVVYFKTRYDAPVSYMSGSYGRGWLAPVIAQGQDRTGMNLVERALEPCIKNAHTIPAINDAMIRIVAVAGILGWKTK